MTYDLNELKELTGQQYDACKSRALERVQARIGSKPTRKQYRREFGPLVTSLDLLAGVIFVAALAISSIHILAYSGHQATTSYATTSAQAIAGISVDPHTYGVIHQIGFILLAESAMLLFFVLFRTRQRLEKWTALLLALLAMVFVIVANLSSGLNVFLSILAPAFTIGIGFRLEAITAENLRRNAEIDRRYMDALTTWERAQDDVTTHPEYVKLLYSELWEKLTSLKANADYRDAPARFKLAAVQRELARDNWIGHSETLPSVITMPTENMNGHREVVADSAPLVTVQPNGHH